MTFEAAALSSRCRRDQPSERYGSQSMRESETIPTDESTARDAPRLRPAPLDKIQHSESIGVVRRRPLGGLGLKTWAVLIISLAVLTPTAGDFGVTWDEPAYRYSQLLSAQWWQQLGEVRSWRDVTEVFDPLTLLYYWHYGRYGINFHPPLAGQLNLAAHALFGHWMKDIPARRMASVIEFALTIAIGFHFLSRRYGVWVGAGHGRFAACSCRGSTARRT